MKKALVQILTSLVITILCEVVLDHFFRKPKAQLKLSNLSKGNCNAHISNEKQRNR